MVFGNLAKAWQLVRDQVFFLQEVERHGGVAVSYTHLTLPTILRV